MSKILTPIVAALALLLTPIGAPGAKAAVLAMDNSISQYAPDLDIDVDVTVNSGVASFLFSNNSIGTASNASIFNVYFESGLASLLGAVSGDANGTPGAGDSVTFTGGIDPLDDGVSPNTPPALGGTPPAGIATWGGNYAAWGRQNENAGEGIGAGETWLIKFVLDDASTTAGDIITALSDLSGNSRIAMHIGNCYYGYSCTTTAGPPNIVPVPPALPLMATALLGLGFVARRRRQQVA